MIYTAKSTLGGYWVITHGLWRGRSDLRARGAKAEAGCDVEGAVVLASPPHTLALLLTYTHKHYISLPLTHTLSCSLSLTDTNILMLSLQGDLRARVAEAEAGFDVEGAVVLAPHRPRLFQVGVEGEKFGF